MKSYIADTNFYLRFILQDVKSQAKEVEEFLRKARDRKINIVFTDEVILEMEFVLRKVYLVEKMDVITSLETLVKTEYIEVENRSLWVRAFDLYNTHTISLSDILLSIKASEKSYGLLTFDRKLKKYAKNS